MRAIGYQKSRPITAEDALVDIDIPKPTPAERDLLVQIKAISVNPVDTKIRTRAEPEAGNWKILGWDAAGIVIETGSSVTGFKPGDEVFYSGALKSPGCNSEYHLVDHRLAAHKPKTLNWAESAALPLTALTAWEMLFDRLDIRKPVPGLQPTLLIIGAAGGVGSIATQLARHLTDLTVIGTASRPETTEWIRKNGAHHVLNHKNPLSEELQTHNLPAPTLVFSTTHTDAHLPEIARLIAPQGRFGLIDDPANLDVNIFKQKSVSTHWEFMFTRALFNTPDLGEQGRILTEIARLADAGTLKTTLSKVLGPINAKTLKQAHTLIESHTTQGKLVLEGFPP